MTTGEPPSPITNRFSRIIESLNLALSKQHTKEPNKKRTVSFGFKKSSQTLQSQSSSEYTRNTTSKRPSMDGRKNSIQEAVLKVSKVDLQVDPKFPEISIIQNEFTLLLALKSSVIYIQDLTINKKKDRQELEQFLNVTLPQIMDKYFDNERILSACLRNIKTFLSRSDFQDHIKINMQLVQLVMDFVPSECFNVEEEVPRKRSLTSSFPDIHQPNPLTRTRTRVFSTEELRNRFAKIAQDKIASNEVNSQENVMADIIQAYADQMILVQSLPIEERESMIASLLILFTKIGRLLSTQNRLSLDYQISNSLNRICTDIVEVMQCEVAIIYIFDELNNELILKEYKEPPRKSNTPFIKKDERIAFGLGLVSAAISSKKLLNISNFKDNYLFNANVDIHSSSITPHNILVSPFYGGENKRVLGVIVAANKQNRISGQYDGFNIEDEVLFKVICLNCSILLRNSLSLEDIKISRRKVEVLLDTTKSLKTLELEKLIEAIMQAAKELLNCDRSTLFLLDKPNEELWTKINNLDIRINMNVGIAGFVCGSGQLLNITDAYDDVRFNIEVDKKTGYRTKSILCLPITKSNGDTVGVIQMINKLSGIFTKEDEQLLTAFASQAGLAIEKSYLFKKTEEIRNYLSSILASITNCVISLDSKLKLKTVNHTWLLTTIGIPLETAMDTSAINWLKEYPILLKDIQSVVESRNSVYGAEYALNDKIINYNIFPIVNEKGITLIVEDITSEKRAVTTLSRYMSPELAKQVVNDRQLGGVRKQVTVMFTDIRHFTELSEGMAPNEVVLFLNEYFDKCINAVIDHKGIVDKFIGDALMAVFGVPFINEQDPTNACNAALDILKSIKLWNEIRFSKGLAPINIGIGLNTGEALSGNIGSDKRMEFSVIGDSVNTASRIESLTKVYKVQCLITENTLRLVQPHLFLTREIDNVIPTGKSLPIKIFELISLKEDSNSDQHVLIKQYQDALALYYENKLEEAHFLFHKLPDNCSKMMAARCLAMIKDCIQFQGVYVYTTK